MTARQDIFNALWWGVPSTSAGDAKRQCGLMLDAYRDAVLREAADKIREHIKDPNPLAGIFTPFAGTLAADLIDPDKETP